MASQLQIDQAGLAAGTPGVSRTDGKADGSVVTLTNTGSGTTLFQLLDIPLDDTTAEGSLAVTANPSVWEFNPTSGARGTYLIELIENKGLSTEKRERRIFGVRTGAAGLLIPALNEVADSKASLILDGADQIEVSDDNAQDYTSNANLNSRRYAGWWRKMYELFIVAEAGATSNTVFKSVSGSHTVTEADWNGNPPAQTTLVLLMDGTSDITMPTDSSLVDGARIVFVKTESSSYTIDLTLASGQIQLRSGPSFSSIGTHTLFSGGGRIVAGDFIYAGAWLSNKIVPRSGGYVQASNLEVSGRSFLVKQTVGTGSGQNLTAPGNSTPYWAGSGDIGAAQASSGELWGRAGTSPLGFNPANDYQFTNPEADGGNPTLRVAPETTHHVDAVLTGTTANYDTDPGLDGYYQFTVTAFVKLATAGTRRRVSATIDAVRVGGGLTIEGSQVDLGGGNNSGVSLTLSDGGASPGDLRAALENTTGETVNGHIIVGWLKTDDPS